VSQFYQNVTATVKSVYSITVKYIKLPYPVMEEYQTGLRRGPYTQDVLAGTGAKGVRRSAPGSISSSRLAGIASTRLSE